MSIKAWHKKKGRKLISGVWENTMVGAIEWKGMSALVTGANDPDVETVRTALKEIQKALNAAIPGISTDDYLTLSSGTYKNVFEAGVKRLKTNIDAYVKTNVYPDVVLYVGFEPGTSIAYCPGSQGGGKLELGTGTKMRNVIVLEAAFKSPYTIGEVRKRLTNKGQCTTILHELTHSLLKTLDVEHVGSGYSYVPANPDKAVTTKAECLALANKNEANNPAKCPLSYLNAENWTRAIWACHPTAETRTAPDRIIVSGEEE